MLTSPHYAPNSNGQRDKFLAGNTTMISKGNILGVIIIE
jgi:hypothetical protein